MPEEKKKLNLVGAISDLVIFVLLVGGAGFFGYFVGINQKLAPVQIVAPGTLEAIASLKNQPEPKPKSAAGEAKVAKPTKKQEKIQPTETKVNPKKVDDGKEQKPKQAKKAKAKQRNKLANLKYWIASAGDNYIGSSVKVIVNGRPVDIFFSPGKLVNITEHIERGQNRIRFESTVLADQYNQHLGNSKYALTLNIVSGKTVSEDYSKESILVSYSRNGADVEDDSQTLGFKAR